MAEQLSKSQFPLVGGSYQSRSRTFDCSRTVNMYPELHDYGAGKNQEVSALYSRSGLRKVNTIGLGPIRGNYTVSNSLVSYVVSGNEVYQLNSASGVPIRLSGNLRTSTGMVSITDNGESLLIVDGSHGYTVAFGTTTLTTISDPHFYNGARTCTYLGGYFICDEGPNSQNFFFSTPDSTSWSSLNEASVDSSPDTLVCVLANNQQLYLLGTKTTEVWALTGATASEPFQPIQGRASNIGCTAWASVRQIAGTFCWLGSNNEGSGVVYSMQNDVPTRISTHAIEWELQQLGDLSGSTAVTWQENGHYFYALACPGADRTFVYDMTTKHWVDFQSLQDGQEIRWLANTHCYLNGEHIIGDYRNNNVYVLDSTYFHDNDQPLRRLRQTPHSSQGVKMLFYNTLQIDIQPGAGTTVINPRYSLQISRDGGFTWGNPIYAAGGLVGKYLSRVRWLRLGQARDTVFRITCDDPVPVVILGAYLSITEGTN